MASIDSSHCNREVACLYSGLYRQVSLDSSGLHRQEFCYSGLTITKASKNILFFQAVIERWPAYIVASIDRSHWIAVVSIDRNLVTVASL